MDIETIANQLGQLTLLEAANLAKLLEQKWGVSAKPAQTIVPQNIIEEIPVQTEFAVVLIEAGEKRIEVIKEIREITKLGLKESKEFAESLPKTVREGLDKESANKLKERLEKVGAKVEIQ